ncbi:hypothetical protein ACNH6C_09875 [Bdellovibrio bacteriovorus]|uniref:hypothetical protein n=1 Tax=Bdellovibrio bacteriovorus TaxID=959 RepID=UPI003A80FE68
MAKPHGFDHFCSYMSGLEDQFVIIGGSAASVLMEEQELEFRPTKDIDLVILTNASGELNSRMSGYVKAGAYSVKEATEGSPKYYRFSSPAGGEYPKVLEIFARNESEIVLDEGQYIIPIANDSSIKLSAILLDEEYFSLIKANIYRTEQNTPLINSVGNICLKARAHRELIERKRTDDGSVDAKDIKKHRNDILKVALTLVGDERPSIGPTVKADLEIALDEINQITADQFKGIMKDYPGVDLAALVSILKTVFTI